MKYFTRLLFTILAGAAAGLVHAQDENSTNSSLQITGGGLEIDTRTDTDRINFLLQVASVYYQDEDYASAIDAYKRILEIDPLQREANFIISHVYISAKQYAQAEQKLKELIEEYPDDFQLKNNLAWLYATAEDPAYRNGSEAIRLAQEAMAIEPNDHHIWSTLSEAYYVTGQYDKAYRAIEHMVWLATRYGANITQEMVDEYNEQIAKCRRAQASQEELEGDEEPEEEAVDTAPSSAGDPAE